MILPTHFFMGQYLYDYIAKETHLKIDKKSFVYGNIKPDFNKELRSLTHRIEPIQNYLQQIIKDICNNNVSKKSSEKLGILCHFLCDTFCSYHFYDRLWEKSTIEHMIYEFKLHDVFMNTDKKLLVPNTEHVISANNFINIFNLIKTDYISDNSSISNDIKYSLTFAIATINSIDYVIKNNNLLKDA